jgi:hypothetical protein
MHIVALTIELLSGADQCYSRKCVFVEELLSMERRIWRSSLLIVHCARWLRYVRENGHADVSI